MKVIIIVYLTNILWNEIPCDKVRLEKVTNNVNRNVDAPLLRVY